MRKGTTRRTFLEAGVVGALAGRGRAARAAQTPALPPHRALTVPGVHAYVRDESVAAGGTVELCVTSTVPYTAAIVRVVGDGDPAADEIVRDLGQRAPAPQPIHPGSYVHAEKAIATPLRALTLECWVRPWRLADAALIAQADGHTAGFALAIGAGGELRFFLGGGWHASAAGGLAVRRWHHVAAVWDGREKALFVDGREVGRWPFATAAVPPARAPLRLAAAGVGGRADRLLDGDLAMPAIHDRALPASEVAARVGDRGASPPAGASVLACWPLREQKGDRVADVSPHGRHGRIVNHATWMVGGPGFDAAVPRFGQYDPAQDPSRGHGLRFAADDLYDCRWKVTHRCRIPADARQGLYVARLRFLLDGKPHLQQVTFVVRRNPRRRRAPILVLAATNTWRAYSGAPFSVNVPEGQRPAYTTDGGKNSAGDPPAFNFYRTHAAGQGTYQLGLRVPWPVAAPDVLYGAPTGYSHLARADRFTLRWLEEAGYDFDVVTDLDLHRDPAMLRAYRAFVINGHSEYWSNAMYDGLERYLRGGGNVVCLSGNTMFWRVSFDPAGTVLECRKVDAPGNQMPADRRGECWHSEDGARGGLLRECGRPGWRLVGLETLGWNNPRIDAHFGPYVVDRADHFLFQQPERVGVTTGDPIGQGAGGKLPRANGHEIDVRLSTLAALQVGPPPDGATMPADPPGMVRLANGTIDWKLGGTAFDYFIRTVKPPTAQGGEMIYWQRPDGGRVFNAGSIGFGWALLADAKLQALMRNVLHHFGVTPTASPSRAG